jgi:hypothetical protein
VSTQFKQAVAWWLRAQGLSVKEVRNIEAGDDRGSSTLTGEWGSEYIKVTYLDEGDREKSYTQDVNFAELIRVLADTDWEGATAELAAEKAEKERLEQERRDAHAKFHRELQVALFDGNTQVSDWVSFAVGKVPVPDQWAKVNNFSRSTGPTLQLRTKDGAGVSSAEAHVQEIITKAYAITWRTAW